MKRILFLTMILSTSVFSKSITFDSEVFIDANKENSTIFITDLDQEIELKVKPENLETKLKELNDQFAKAAKTKSKVSVKTDLD